LPKNRVFSAAYSQKLQTIQITIVIRRSSKDLKRSIRSPRRYKYDSVYGRAFEENGEKIKYSSPIKYLPIRRRRKAQIFFRFLFRSSIIYLKFTSDY